MNVSKLDYLHMRTTNINVRISPLLKSALIETAAEMGLNLSDFIMHVLTKKINGDYATCQECEKLQSQLEEKGAEVLRYEQLAEPFSKAIGTEITINGKTVLIKNSYDILAAISQNFKTRE